MQATQQQYVLLVVETDLLNVYASRTLKSFEAWLRKGGKSTDYIAYMEICTMMNVIIDCKNKALHLCALDHGQNMVG